MENATRFDKRRMRFDHLIQRFFGGNALIAIVVLALITLFLFREGAGFFPQNLENLRVYRLAGLEYVDLMRGQVAGHTNLNRKLQDIRVAQVHYLNARKLPPEEITAQLAAYDAFAEEFADAVDPLRSIASDLADVASAVKAKVTARNDEIERRRFLMEAGRSEEAGAIRVPEIDFATETQPLRDALPAWQQASLAFRTHLAQMLTRMPEPVAPAFRHRFATLERATRAYLNTFPANEHRLENWDQFAPVPWYRGVTSFLFGTAWITNSFWQDVYGVLPLFTGSFIIALIALAIAVPLGICAAIYVSEIATPREQQLIKPYIEFISAIPSVVLGFFGIVVLGNAVRAFGDWPVLSLIGGLNISERLNAFTAGALLALMAVPTIFSLAEDALNSVPRHFKEASYALGASRFQTIFRILIPAALSGMISAVLLGFGRVIGETMVVLLCAGNRIAIPDFTSGLNVLFEPVHTMTGIIAQEMGEVARGTIHYRALFMVGLLLFFIALLVNWLAQMAVRRFKSSIG